VPPERDWVRIVASERCDECGLETSTVTRDELGGSIGYEGHEWRSLLCDTDVGALRWRPDPARWSALEYGAHVRDVLGVFVDRIGRAMAETDAEFGWWDHEASVLEERYNDQRPRAVAVELEANAGRMVSALARLDDGSWQRRGTRRSGEVFTVEGLARFALHEARHHRLDAARTIATRT